MVRTAPFLAFGMTVFMASLAGVPPTGGFWAKIFIFTAASTVGPSSGGSFNPARSLDPVLYNQDWGNVWIYIVGPLTGGIIGGVVWSVLVARRPLTA